MDGGGKKERFDFEPFLVLILKGALLDSNGYSTMPALSFLNNESSGCFYTSGTASRTSIIRDDIIANFQGGSVSWYVEQQPMSSNQEQYYQLNGLNVNYPYIAIA